MPIIRASQVKDLAISARNIVAGAVGLSKLAANSVNAAKLINLDTAGVHFGPSFSATVDISNATADTDIVVPVKCQVIGVTACKTAANGGVGDTVQLKNGSGTAISDAMSVAISTDGGLVSATSLDPATSTLAAGATLRIAANSATNCACQVRVIFIPRS